MTEELNQDMSRDEPRGDEKRQRATWPSVFLIGLGLFALALLGIYLTGNPNLFPTVVLIGNFLVPVTYVAFFYDRRHLAPRRLTLPLVAAGFIYGGVLGVVAASLLSPIFVIQLGFVTSLFVGLIEEFAKILGVLVIARNRCHNSELSGIILGAAAGMGFAALESSGYAFTAFLRSGGDLSATVGTTLIRGVLSPLGHGTWTAILAAVLFRESGPGRYRLNRKVLGAYLTVVVLHWFWNALPATAVNFMGANVTIAVIQLTLGGIGLFILWRLYSQAVKREASRLPALNPAADDPHSSPEDRCTEP